MTGKRLTLGLLGLAISAAILWWMASLVDWNRFAATLPDGVLVPLGLSSGLYALTLAVRAWRFSWLFGRIAKTKVSFFTAFDLVALNNVLNHLLPLRAGEIAFLTLARRQLGVGVTESTLMLFVARLGDLAGLLLGMAVVIWWIPKAPLQVRGILLGLALLATFTLWRVDVAVAVGRYFVAKLSALMPAFVRKKLVGVLEKLDRVSPLLGDRSLFTKNLALSATIWGVNTVFFFVVMRILALDVNFAQVFIGGSGAALLPSLPINAFGTLGTLEAGWAAGFVLVGVPKDPATASGFILHGVILLMSGLTGAWAARLLVRPAPTVEDAPAHKAMPLAATETPHDDHH